MAHLCKVQAKTNTIVHQRNKKSNYEICNQSVCHSWCAFGAIEGYALTVSVLKMRVLVCYCYIMLSKVFISFLYLRISTK